MPGRTGMASGGCGGFGRERVDKEKWWLSHSL